MRLYAVFAAFPVLVGGCINTIWFPPDLNVWETADTGWQDTVWTEGLHAEPPAPDPTTPVTPPGDAVTVATVDWGCDGAETYWAGTVTTTGWVGGGTIDLFHPTLGGEAHTLTVARSDPEGAWDELRVGPLLDGVPAASQVPDVNTRYDCAIDAATVSFAVRIRDLAGDLIDCAVGGADPAAATAGIRAIDPEVLALGGCRDTTGI